MSDAQDFAGSFRDNNEEIFDFLYRGVYHHPVYVIDSILNDDEIKAKLTRILDFYHKPNEQSKARLERDLKLHGTHPLTNTMKNFIVQLSLKIDLNQEQTLRLVELFFISHPGVYERVKSQETEQVQKELGNLFRPIIDLYYKERINLIKAGTQIVINATAEGHPAQPVCSEFIAEILENKYNEKIWNQYKEICKKEIPSSVYAPQEREEWFMQTLKEEKQLLELLVLLNYGFVHCTPERFVEYLNVYTDQEFKGSYKIIVADSHLNEYRLGSREILMQISDLSLFHLLSSIRLDIFATQGALPGVLSVKNPYNLISNPDQTRKIHEFFVGLTGNLERLSGQIGPVVLAWYCLLMWGQHFPQSQIDVSSIDLKPLEFLIQNFDILSYLHQITKRSPFNGPQIELSCALKYILINLISTFSYQIKIEDKNNFLGLVQTTCACLENEGSSDALRHFWSEHFPNRNGLYNMLNALAERYPHESEGFLQFVNVLVGDMTHSYAEEVVNYLDNLQTFTFPVNKENTSSTGEENELKAVGTLTSPAIVIISGTRGKILEFKAANSIVVRWAVRYSLWPVLWIYWEEKLRNLKQGQSRSEEDMKTLCNCLDLVCHILKLTPGISTTLEAKCLREPANDPAEVRVTDKQKGTPNLELCRMLIETFIELSRVSAPPLETLSIIIDALRAVAISEFENCEKNAVIMALKMISIDRYGMVNIYTHPLFLNINKLQISERDANNYSTSVSLLSFCIEIISNDYFVIEFPVDSSGLIGETLKFVISEIIPECFDYPDVYRWKSASLSFEFLTEIFKKFDKFAYPQAIFVNPLLDLITAQLNKIDIAEFIINCLQVKVKNELNEISYENVHLSKEFESNNDPEILRGIKTMIFNALRALDEIVTLILYSERIGKESGFENVQLVKDIRGTLYQNLGDEESLPLITALMSYVAFQMKKCPINDDDEFWAIPSLSMLTKIVMIYGNSPQKPALEHFLTGNYKQAKDDFVSYFWICFSNKSVNLPHDNKIKLTKAYLEFLIISLPLQKSFSTSILTAENFVLEFKSIINSYVDFKKDEMIGYETMEQLFHYVTLYEEIINNWNLYTPIYNSIFQEQGFLNRTLDAIENVFSGIKDPKKFEGCLALHCFTSVMNVLLHNANKNSQDKEHAIKHIFRDEVLTHVLRLSSRAVSNQSTDYLFNEIEETLKQQGAYVNISDLAMLQLHNKPHWRLFDINQNQYGKSYLIELNKLPIILKYARISEDTIKDIITNVKAINIEKSLLDAQLIALTKFKQLFGYLVGYGNSNKPLSLVDKSSSLENKCLVISPAKTVIESHAQAFHILAQVADTIWIEISKEANSRNELVIKCLEEKYEIVMYAFNLAIHIYQSRQEYSQSSSSSQKVAEYEETAREEFHRLAKKIMNEFAEFFERLQQPTIGILSLVLVVFGYFIKARSEGTDNKSEQFVRAIIPFISRFLNLETPFFALIVTIFEESLEFLPHQEGYDVYKTQSCIRIMLDKLSSSKCSDQEFLSVLKFCFNFSKNKQSARLLFNERILNQLSASSQLKVKSEYVNRYRDSQHLLWCWVLLLLNQMHDILSDDPAFLSQLYAFISVFNDRFENILRFNMSVDGKYGKQIMSHKQFSLGYLEELDLMTSLIKKFIDNYKYWKTSHKDMIENWIYLICQQTLRIYSSAVDISHSFPPVSEHEIKMSNKIITEFSIQDKKYEYFNKYKQDSPRRSILESIPTRNISENSQKTNKIQPSVFTYRVEATLLSCLTNILSSLIDIIQISRNISLLDPILLLDVGKFCKLLYHKLNQDQNYYKNLERIGNAEYQSAENSLLYGSFNHTYNIDTEKLVDVAQAVFEMSFYLVSKAELSGISDIKSEAGYELEEWKKIASSGTENDDRFIDWLRDEFK